jgi:histone chaperone ASF1
VGYYVNNEYDCEEMRMAPPEVVQPERILRTILADKPRVTRFPIRWDDILDETLKKPEDEEMDKDADLRGPGPDAHPQQQDDEDDDDEEDDDEDDDHDEEGVEEAEVDDDEFTSQLGPEEQDRMSMMIDEGDCIREDDENMEAMVDSNQQIFPTSSSTMLKPSPLAMNMHMEEDTAMMM